jgi:hypothetical protein
MNLLSFIKAIPVTARREDATLKRLLNTPPDHKTKPKGDGSPKKRGRPPRINAGGK